MSPSPHRTAFAVARTLGVVRGGIGYTHPGYCEPTTRLDWGSLITFSALLAALTAAMLMVANDQRAVGSPSSPAMTGRRPAHSDAVVDRRARPELRR
jgi:hypothetical protein